MKRPAAIIWLIDAKIVDAVRLGPEQRIIAVVHQRDRKSRTEARNPGKLPSLRQTIIGVEQALERDLIAVADYKVVCHVERGECTAERRVQGIDGLPDIR